MCRTVYICSLEDILIVGRSFCVYFCFLYAAFVHTRGLNGPPETYTHSNRLFSVRGFRILRLRSEGYMEVESVKLNGKHSALYIVLGGFG